MSLSTYQAACVPVYVCVYLGGRAWTCVRVSLCQRVGVIGEHTHANVCCGCWCVTVCWGVFCVSLSICEFACGCAYVCAASCGYLCVCVSIQVWVGTCPCARGSSVCSCLRSIYICTLLPCKCVCVFLCVRACISVRVGGLCE